MAWGFAMADSVRSYRDLQVWQKAIDLVVECYRISDQFPKTELYGLTSQLKRASVSIAANIAEGRGRRRTGSFLHFLDIAYGSLVEVETLLEIACRVSFLTTESLETLLSRTSEIGRMLNGLIAPLEHKRDA